MTESNSQDPGSEYISHTPTYHQDKQSAYVLPNDSPEHIRLETQARHLSAIMNDRIIHAPIDKSKVHRILDVGCGTGVVTDWLARSFPEAEVSGLDLSAVPQFRDRPKNTVFYQGNILTEKPSNWRPSSTSDSTTTAALPDREAFDLIYSRLLVCGMSAWPEYIRTEYQLLKPGGWAEVHDLDWIWYDASGKVISDDWPWWVRLRSAGEKRGLDFSCGQRTRKWMSDAGFRDVQVWTYRWPFGAQRDADETWREFGHYVSSAMVEMTWHLIARLMQGEASQAEIEQMRADMKRDFAPEEGKHWIMYLTAGQKPG